MDGLGKMVNEMIQKRMQDQYAKWNSDDPEDRKKIRDEHLQQAYDRIAAALQYLSGKAATGNSVQMKAQLFQN